MLFPESQCQLEDGDGALLTFDSQLSTVGRDPLTELAVRLGLRAARLQLRETHSSGVVLRILDYA
jgi:hypothetical protein